MSLRQTLNNNPILGGAITVVVIGVAVWFLYRTMSDRGGTADLPTQYYYTTDDGQTLFAGALDQVPPFTKDGKEAVRAHVYSCDDGSTKFIGYLEKYTDEFKKRAEQRVAASAGAKADAPGGMGPTPAANPLNAPDAPMNMLVKKPGEKAWVRYASAEGAAAMAVACPNGGDRNALSEVDP